jgi:hypothetical protein
MMGISAEKDIVPPRILEILPPGKPIAEGEKLSSICAENITNFGAGMEKESPRGKSSFPWDWKKQPGNWGAPVDYSRQNRRHLKEPGGRVRSVFPHRARA